MLSVSSKALLSPVLVAPSPGKKPGFCLAEELEEMLLGVVVQVFPILQNVSAAWLCFCLYMLCRAV